jgi:hypothetical protein
MSEQKPDQPSQADRTLLGVAPPKLESTPESGGARSPVFVRSGTAELGTRASEPPPLPRMALPSRPPSPSPFGLEAPPAFALAPPTGETTRDRLLRVARRNPVLWMVAAPAAISLTLVTILWLVGPPPVETPSPRKSLAETPAPTPEPPSNAAPARPGTEAAAKPSVSLADLEARPPASLSAKEVMELAELRREQKQATAQALSSKLESTPDLAGDKATQKELLALTLDPDTARQALGAMASMKGSAGADLLYEVWTGTTQRTHATELARALVLSTDVRPRASPALSVALELRAAESCEQNKAVLPKALKDGDRRSLHLLTKLLAKRGCGPKKTEDCNACLREDAQELIATINAVKVRRAPAF